MDPSIVTTLNKTFPKDYEKIIRRIGEDPELASIIHDLIECEEALTYWEGGHKKDRSRRKMYSELLENLKEEVHSLLGAN